MQTLESPVATPLPLRGKNVIEMLLHDHKAIKELLLELITARTTIKCTKTLELLRVALTIHNSMEESVVYPALAEIAGKQMEAGRLYHETAEISVKLFELETILREARPDIEAAFVKKAKELEESILSHFTEEESSAFPALQKKAGPERMAMLMNALREFREDFQYHHAALC